MITPRELTFTAEHSGLPHALKTAGFDPDAVFIAEKVHGHAPAFTTRFLLRPTRTAPDAKLSERGVVPAVLTWLKANRFHGNYKIMMCYAVPGELEIAVTETRADSKQHLAIAEGF